MNHLWTVAIVALVIGVLVGFYLGRTPYTPPPPYIGLLPPAPPAALVADADAFTAGHGWTQPDDRITVEPDRWRQVVTVHLPVPQVGPVRVELGEDDARTLAQALTGGADELRAV